ncbi:MAG TPA: tetratricopeptide repeat protein [Terracidiphilus sp.]|nr:tetratricopeptide repeat protein [Terracidiphilus sp.]
MTAMPHKVTYLSLLLIPVFCISTLAQAPQDTQSQIAEHSRLAEQYLQEKRPDLAIPEFQKVVALDPNNVDARGNLGVLLFFRGNYKDAVPQLRTVVKLQPELWKLQALLGLGEGRLGDSAASQTDLEAAFPHLMGEKIQREVGEALIGDYTAKEELEKAAAVVSTLLAADSTDKSLLYMSYRIYSDLAGRSMLTLALVAPESAEMHQVMARELARQNHNAEAIANYRAAIKLNPKLAGLYTELGDLLLNSEDMAQQAEAGDEFKAALALNPNDERAELELGMVEARKGNIKAAYADYSRAIELNPNDGDACTEMAMTLMTMNQTEKAQQMFERAVQIDPTNDVAHYRLATLYRKAGKIDAAKEQVQLYLKYKQMKDKMEKIFDDMRLLSPSRPRDDEEGKQQSSSPAANDSPVQQAPAHRQGKIGTGQE